jgi:hypothetical protein
MATAPLPFTVRILGNIPSTDAQGQLQHFLSLLPATNRTARDDIVSPQLAVEFLEQELSVKKINAIQAFLWLCGRPMPARPLNYQAILGRNVTVTENIELHLVWLKKRILIKPMPPYLLDPDFWSVHLLPSEAEKHVDPQRQQLLECALGFLFSYTSLIAYESDFRIAKDKGLLPEAVTWGGWKELCTQYLQHHCYSSVNPRYWYGELRLTRLNLVYHFKKNYVLRGYSKIGGHAVYEDLLRDNFATLAGVLGYVVILLTAMQLGLATDKLGHNDSFQSASYGFTVFAMIVPLIMTALIFLGVVVLFVNNWLATKAYERKRFRDLGVESVVRSRERNRSEKSGDATFEISEATQIVDEGVYR